MKDTFIPRIHHMARAMGADRSIVSVTSLDMAVEDLATYKDQVSQRLEERMVAITTKGVDVLVLGCTGMMGVASPSKSGSISVATWCQWSTLQKSAYVSWNAYWL